MAKKTLEYYDINDPVYIVVTEETSNWVDCKTCEGAGQLYTKSGINSFRCPECEGKGDVDYGGPMEYVVKMGIVTRLDINIDIDTDEIDYYVYVDNDGVENVRDDMVFNTEKKAKNECKRISVLSEG